jgi:hypothetical protein
MSNVIDFKRMFSMLDASKTVVVQKVGESYYGNDDGYVIEEEFQKREIITLPFFDFNNFRKVSKQLFDDTRSDLSIFSYEDQKKYFDSLIVGKSKEEKYDFFRRCCLAIVKGGGRLSYQFDREGVVPYEKIFSPEVLGDIKQETFVIKLLRDQVFVPVVNSVEVKEEIELTCEKDPVRVLMETEGMDYFKRFDPIERDDADGVPYDQEVYTEELEQYVSKTYQDRVAQLTEIIKAVDQDKRICAVGDNVGFTTQAARNNNRSFFSCDISTKANYYYYCIHGIEQENKTAREFLDLLDSNKDFLVISHILDYVPNLVLLARERNIPFVVFEKKRFYVGMYELYTTKTTMGYELAFSYPNDFNSRLIFESGPIGDNTMNMDNLIQGGKYLLCGDASLHYLDFLKTQDITCDINPRTYNPVVINYVLNNKKMGISDRRVKKNYKYDGIIICGEYDLNKLRGMKHKVSIYQSPINARMSLLLLRKLIYFNCGTIEDMWLRSGHPYAVLHSYMSIQNSSRVKTVRLGEYLPLISSVDSGIVRLESMHLGVNIYSVQSCGGFTYQCTCGKRHKLSVTVPIRGRFGYTPKKTIFRRFS